LTYHKTITDTNNSLLQNEKAREKPNKPVLQVQVDQFSCSFSCDPRWQRLAGLSLPQNPKLVPFLTGHTAGLHSPAVRFGHVTEF
jgi:hypothetical protein